MSTVDLAKAAAELVAQADQRAAAEAAREARTPKRPYVPTPRHIALGAKLDERLAATPSQLQEHGAFALFGYDKTPYLVGPVLSHAPQLYPCKGNDPSRLTSFADAARAVRMRRHAELAGVTLRMNSQQGLVCLDIDDVRGKLASMAATGTISAEVQERADKQQRCNDEMLAYYLNAGAYVERSLSGNGWHVFVAGRLPADRYSFDFCGGIFTTGQFIHLTGDKHPQSGSNILVQHMALNQMVAHYVGTMMLVPSKANEGLKSPDNIDTMNSIGDQEPTEGLEDVCARMLATNNRFLISSANILLTGDASWCIKAPGDISEATYQVISDLDKFEPDPRVILQYVLASPLITRNPYTTKGRLRVEKVERLFAYHMRLVRASNARLAEERARAKERGEALRQAMGGRWA